MEDRAVETWECPSCHATGNTARFCAKCGLEKPVTQSKASSEERKAKSKKVIETIVAIAMIIFFSCSLVLVLSPMAELRDHSSSYNISFYYYVYTVWANLKNSGEGVETAKALICTFSFIGAVALVYFFGIKGLIDSIKVIKLRKEPKYTKEMMAVIGTMFAYYSIVLLLNNANISNGSGYQSCDSGAGIVLFIMLLCLLLGALMARSFVYAIIDKKPFKIAATIIKFVSIIFIISAVAVSSKLGMKYVSGGTNLRLSFFNWATSFFGDGSTGPATTTLIAFIATVLGLVAGIGTLCLSYGSLIDDKKDTKAGILAIAYNVFLWIVIALSTATFFLVDVGTAKFSPLNTPAAIILSLLGIIGTVVAAALEKETKTN